ncbi:hypothetical protein O6H91_14G038800 [Diphasiastrum complanatum]|uniref:Uncharacterized protein n=1 Tax=Diphasiastrum complanatum TaxID=34168 RepID=A0ACC2BP42_DIPCM|nr:hypothetical protein O6H91_14G038800 [Diphasiastrum complanatum]
MGYDAAQGLLSVVLFIVAAGCEVGGVWLIWNWRREGWRWPFFILGGILLVVFGIMLTLQDQGLGRTLAAFGGFSIAYSVLWRWGANGSKPDQWDAVGATLALAGACVIMYVPRN